jgi:hypothetical protein
MARRTVSLAYPMVNLAHLAHTPYFAVAQTVCIALPYVLRPLWRTLKAISSADQAPFRGRSRPALPLY